MLRNILWIVATLVGMVFVFSLNTSSNHGLPTHKLIKTATVSSMHSSPPSPSVGKADPAGG